MSNAFALAMPCCRNVYAGHTTVPDAFPFSHWLWENGIKILTTSTMHWEAKVNLTHPSAVLPQGQSKPSVGLVCIYL